MHGTLQRMPKSLASALAIAGTLAAGTAGGAVARLVHLPLPWLLGSLFTIMALSLAGAPVKLISWGRPAGTLVVGASTGLQFTATVVAKLVTLLPLIIAGALLSTIVGAIGGLIYMRLSGVDRRMPDLLIIAARVVIGVARGARFRPDFLTRLFRLLWASCVVVLFAAGSMALFGAAIAWLMGYPVPTMVLAMAPAGIAEMV